MLELLFAVLLFSIISLSLNTTLKNLTRETIAIQHNLEQQLEKNNRDYEQLVI